MSQRFSRQELLPEIGVDGQKALASSRVLIVGVGGLGCPAAQYLAAMGVGEIGLMDGDVVEESNLHRQILFGPNDLGCNKAEAAARRLKSFYPDTSIKIHAHRLSAGNALDVVSQYDLVVDGTDVFSAKFLINDASVKLGRPFVWGVAVQLEGRVAVFWPGHGPCYRCFQPRPPQVRGANCNEVGVLGAVPGLIGTWQAIETVKTLIRLKDPSSIMGPDVGLMLSVAFEDMSVFRTRVAVSPECPACWNTADLCIREEQDFGACVEGTDRGDEITWEQLEAAHDFVVVDVREGEEFGLTDEAWLNLPLSLIQSDPSRVLEDVGVDRPLALVCRSGVRSRTALAILKAAHPEGKIYSVRGGVLARDSAKLSPSR